MSTTYPYYTHIYPYYTLIIHLSYTHIAYYITCFDTALQYIVELEISNGTIDTSDTIGDTGGTGAVINADIADTTPISISIPTSIPSITTNSNNMSMFYKASDLYYNNAMWK